MKNRYYIDPYKFGIALGTIAVCVLLCIWNLTRGQPEGLFFLLPALPFVYVAWLYGAILEVDPEQLRLTRFGKTARSVSWTELAEMGVVGTKVFNKGNPDKTGNLYIYFSRAPLEEEERFQLALKWPPKEQLYLLYTKERMDAIRPLWFGKVQAYNTGKLKDF